MMHMKKNGHVNLLLLPLLPSYAVFFSMDGYFPLLWKKDNPRGLTPPHIVFLYSQNETPKIQHRLKIQAHLLLHSLDERACSFATTPTPFPPSPKT
jgi:hypothetical protein